MEPIQVGKPVEMPLCCPEHNQPMASVTLQVTQLRTKESGLHEPKNIGPFHVAPGDHVVLNDGASEVEPKGHPFMEINIT